MLQVKLLGSISLTSRLNRVSTSESQSESEMLDYRWLCKSAMAGLLLVRYLLTFVPHDQQ